MEAVTREIYDLILQLQELKVLEYFSLAGGTNLALRFNRRRSVDIDLFSDRIIGESGFKDISAYLKKSFKGSLLFSEIINTESGNQYCFLRALINKKGTGIKVELIQNIQLLDEVEILQGINLLSVKDVGVFKLLSATSRKANKDIYDLDLITDEIRLEELLGFLEEKQKLFSREEHKSLFHLDNPPSPVDNPSLLLGFDNIDYSSLPLRPSHSNDRIDLVTGAKSWQSAKISWRRKVKDLMNKRGINIT